jgi:hypothetical protein
MGGFGTPFAFTAARFDNDLKCGFGRCDSDNFRHFFRYGAVFEQFTARVY